VTFTALDAAVMLHTHAAAAALEEADSDEASLHLDQAQKILEWTSARRAAGGRLAGPAQEPCDTRPQISRREWYLAATRLTLAEWVLSGAEEFAARLVRAAPEDPDALFAAGNVQEALATNEAQYYLPPPTGRYSGLSAWKRAQNRYLESLRNRKRYREAARQLYARALKLAPGRQDVRLRFGWVSVLLEREGDARPALESVVANPDSRANQYLAALFLGRLHERAGRFGDAVSTYRLASLLLPDAHVARIALSHALWRQGSIDESLAEALRALEPPGPSAESDPWTAYPHGDWTGGVRLLDRLRLRVSEPPGSAR
jgi:tetratricopeptide (TPR) repeat protein